jgi:hypothetical protein
MILYHFTDFYLLEAGGTILTEGLKPGVEKQGWWFPPHDVVWLTTEEDYRWAERKASEADQCRIRLAIPSHDRRLVHWPKWLRKRAPEIIAMLALCDSKDGGNAHTASMNATYCYFGTVPLAYFREIEYADPAKRLAFEQAGEAA